MLYIFAHYESFLEEAIGGINDYILNTIEADSIPDAIRGYICDDNVSKLRVIKIIILARYYEDKNTDLYKNACNLFSKFKEIMVRRHLIVKILEDYTIYDNDKYQQLIYDDLDLITELMEKISGRQYFTIRKSNPIVNGTLIKSAAKQ